MRRITAIFVLSMAVMTAAWLPPAAATSAAGSPAPNFTLKRLDGENIKLSELRGEVVAVVFWGSWCTPCLQLLDTLNTLYSNYRDDAFTILAVSVDDRPAIARGAANELSLDFPVLLDHTKQVSKQFSLQDIPSLFLVDRDGVLRYAHEGYTPGDEREVESEIKTLFAQ